VLCDVRADACGSAGDQDNPCRCMLHFGVPSVAASAW
jgi:hypothetical protein